jgi:succinate dehydrogenase / fumarate reductase cytochrome b subunit
MQDSTIKETRPLSPHLQIYRPMLTMMMSVAHRISGAALATGFVLLAWWLLAISAGPAPFAVVNRFFASVPGQMLLFLYSWALLHHMLGGIRHLIWDTGRGLDRVSIEIFAWATIVGSTTLNLLLWLAGYWLKGSA